MNIDELKDIIRAFEERAWDGDPLRRADDDLCIRARQALESHPVTYEEAVRAAFTAARQVIIVAFGSERASYAQLTLKDIDKAFKTSVAVLKAQQLSDEPYEGTK